jgi:hypothetical protein
MTIHVVMAPEEDEGSGAGGRGVIVMELFLPVCSDHSGIRHKVPKSSPLHRKDDPKNRAKFENCHN